MMNIKSKNKVNSPIENNPLERWGRDNGSRIYLFVNFDDSSVNNIVEAINPPTVNPIVGQVDVHWGFKEENKQTDHPSTTISSLDINKNIINRTISRLINGDSK